MDEAVMRKHIELYVNEYTEELGSAGEQAIRVLFRKAQEAGLIPGLDMARIFY
jgi:1,4-dihydroxy-6-naphthoate synthase